MQRTVNSDQTSPSMCSTWIRSGSGLLVGLRETNRPSLPAGLGLRLMYLPASSSSPSLPSLCPSPRSTTTGRFLRRRRRPGESCSSSSSDASVQYSGEPSFRSARSSPLGDGLGLALGLRLRYLPLPPPAPSSSALSSSSPPATSDPSAPSTCMTPSALPSLLRRGASPSVSSRTLRCVKRGSWISHTDSPTRSWSTNSSMVRIEYEPSAR